MAKIATTIEQSQQLAKILPIESADMHWSIYGHNGGKVFDGEYQLCFKSGSYMPDELSEEPNIPAWSLSALMDLLPEEVTYETENLDEWEDYKFFFLKENGEYYVGYDGYNDEQEFISTSCEDLVDACVEMIIKLNEKGLL